MEEVSFSWILFSVSLGNYYLPILETFIFKEEKLFCGYFLNDEKLIRRSYSENIGISSYIQELISKLSIKNKLRRLSENICCVSTKNTKDYLNYKELKDLASNHLLTSKITKVQLTKANYFREIKTFVFTLSSTSGSYESSFQEAKNSSFFPCKVKNYYEKAKDIANLIIAFVQSQRNKKIIEMRMELISDDNFALWLLDISHCAVIDWTDKRIISIENIEKFDSMNMKKFQSFDEIKTYTKVPMIPSPEITNLSEKEENESDEDEDEESLEILGLPMRNSIVRKEGKKKRQGFDEDNDKFNDFVEILSKTYAKFGVQGTSRLVSQDDVDKEFRRIYGLLSPDNEISRKQSQTSLNFSSPKSPPAVIKRHRNSNAPAWHSSRKASEIIGQKIPVYRIRVLKTLKGA